MIRECVGFVEEYLRHYNPKGKSSTAFIIDNIFLSTAEEVEKSTDSKINESEIEEMPKTEKEETQIFLIFPFEKSENGLKLKQENIIIKRKSKVTELLELDIVKKYNYSREEISDLKGIFETPKKHIALVSDNNKRIGGSQNLSSSVIYAIELASCKTSDNNSIEFKKGSLESTSFWGLFEKEKEQEYILKTRFRNFLYGDEYIALSKFGLNDIGRSLAEWFYSDELAKTVLEQISKLCAANQGKSSIIIINLIPHQENISNIYATIREEYFKQNVFKNTPKTKGTCSCCSKNECLVEAPQNEIAMDNKKRFLEHPTMLHAAQNKPVLICHNCAINYAAFFGLLKKWKLKIVPLFIDPILQTKEIRLIDEKELNSFSQILNQIGDYESFEFYLMLFSSGELKYCDYVSNYTWEIEWVNYSQYYNRQNGQTNKIKRNLFELKVCTAIGIKHLNYFEDQKGLNNLQSYLRNLLSEKIFNFVYRNRNQFTQQDLWQLSILPFEQLILGSQKEFEEQNYRRVQICLEIWFNQNQLLNLKEGIYVSIEELRNNVQIGDSSEKWAYRAGVTYRFLVSKQAGQKNLELENIVRSHQNQTVKNAIVKKLEQRSHALDEGELKQFRLQLAELLAFNKFDGVNFKELKPYFYAGYIDQIKNERKIGGDSI